MTRSRSARWGRRALLAALVAAALLTAALVALSLRPVQRALWDLAADRLTAGTGWSITAGDVRLGVLAGSLRIEDLELAYRGSTVAAADTTVLSWDWTRLLVPPRRVDRVQISGGLLDLRNLPPPGAESQEAGGRLPLEALEIGELELAVREVLWSTTGVDRVVARQVSVTGALEGGRAEGRATADVLRAVREGRILEVPAVQLGWTLGPESIGLEVATGEPSEVSATGTARVRLGGDAGLQTELELQAGLERLARWWDPELARRIEPRGELRLAGAIGWSERGGLEGMLQHRGEAVVVAGYPIGELRLLGVAGPPRLEASSPEWGFLELELQERSRLELRASFDDAGTAPAAGRLPPKIAEWVPGPLTISGTADVTFPATPEIFNPARIEGQADLEASWPGGVLSLEARTIEGGVRVRELVVEVADARLEAGGRVMLDRRVSAEIGLEVPSPARLVSALEPWLPDALGRLPVSGGPLTARAELEGPLDTLGIDARLGWQDPAWGSLSGRTLELVAQGDTDDLQWQLEAASVEDVRLHAEGRAALDELHLTGQWRLAGASTVTVAALAPPLTVTEVAARGRFEWRGGLRQATATVLADELSFGQWRLDGLVAEARVASSRFELHRFELRGLGALLAATASFPISGDGEVAADVRLDGLELQALPLGLPTAFDGIVTGRVRAAGSTGQTSAELEVEWQPAAPGALPPLSLTGTVSSGRLWLEARPAELAGGTLEARAAVPLGDVPRPDWLWPGAPDGAASAVVEVDRVRLQPLLALAGIEAPPLEVESGVRLEVLWQLWGDGPRHAELALTGLEASTSGETLRARGPLRLQYRDGTVAVQPFELEGEVSSAQGEAQLELGGGAGWASAELVIGPSWLRLMPIDLDATGAVEVRLRFGGLTSAPGVRIELEQRDGELLMRDPPVRITNLEAELELADGVWSIPDGSADVNQGRVLLGGEWNVETGQGVIFGLEDVSFLLPEGILTRWDGAVVVEPAAGRAARVIGELMMNGGLWHQEVDLQAALFGDEVETGTTAELMYDVVVDVEVYGRGALEVENNLGDFEITWHVLDIGGTLAEPLIQGELTLVPGGVITLTGAAVEIARGTIRFTGEPGAAPEVEVMPARDAFALGGEGGAGFDADLLLRRGVAGSLGSALGLRNKSLAPATIAVETLSDPSTNYLISRQIGRYVALFVAADLTDVQERTMLLQISNWRRIPGLAVQGIDDSRTGAGLAVIERLSWGGTFSERPRIRRVRFEGDWPLGRRRLKRALQLESGQLYDPFLVFVGRVRLERELARAGYYQARVNGTVSEDPKLPGLSFTVEPGPRREVVFDGGDLPAKVRRDVTARYRPPPARKQGFAEMRRVVREYLDAVHHPYATVEVAQEGEAVAVRIDRGTEVVFEGPSAAGVADDAEQTLQRLLGSAAELAEVARERPEALRRAERLLSLEGYVEPRIRRVRLEKLTQDRTRIHLEVEHGGRSAVGEVVVSGRDPLQVVEGGELPITAGMPARRGALAAVERMLRDVYRDEGYTEVEVEGRFVGEGELRDVVLEIDPGRQHRVAEVRIAGRRHISESLLRKGIVLEEGDLVRPRTINRSIVQLAGFAPIARVDVETEDAGPGEVDFDIHITERARWTVGAGARWSADTGLLGLFDLRDDGLFQRGFSLNLRGLVGSERNALALIGSLPRPPGGRWSSSLTLSYRDVPSTTEPDRVQEESRSASVEATVRLRESLAMRGYYLFDDRVSTSLEVDPLPSGERRVRQTTLGWQGIIDRLDDPLDPRRGYYLAADVGWSTPTLGGDVEALRTLFTASWASAPKSGWTWARTLRLGWAEPLDDEPLEEQVRFFAGGEASIRGFERDLVGPVATRPDGSLRPLGGAALFVLNEEIRIPVWRHETYGIFRVAVFADIGQIWPRWSDAGFDLAVGAGLGLRWNSPVGPVWADVAWPVADVRGDDGPKFYLGLGRPF